MLNVYIPSVEFLKIKKYIHTGFHFVALILNNTMVQTKSKTDSRFKRKMCFKLANQLNLHPLNQTCRDTCHPNFEAVRWSAQPAGISATCFCSARILKWKFHSKLSSGRCICFPVWLCSACLSCFAWAGLLLLAVLAQPSPAQPSPLEMFFDLI